MPNNIYIQCLILLICITVCICMDIYVQQRSLTQERLFLFLEQVETVEAVEMVETVVAEVETGGKCGTFGEVVEGVQQIMCDYSYS